MNKIDSFNRARVTAAEYKVSSRSKAGKIENWQKNFSEKKLHEAETDVKGSEVTFDRLASIGWL